MRLSRHASPANMVYEMWQRLEVAWNELPASVTQAHFDSILYRIRTVLAAKGRCCFYISHSSESQTVYKFNHFVFMPYCLRTLNTYACMYMYLLSFMVL